MQKTDNSIILAIDTAGPQLQLALSGAKNDVLVENIAKGHAEIVFARIAMLLERNQISYADLSRLAVTSGPGSFTGLRIGLSVARGLGLGLDIPVIGVPTLFAMALSHHGDQPFSVLVDARRGEAYAQEFVAPGRPKGDATLLPIEQAGTDGQLVHDALIVDIKSLADFALTADPETYSSDPTYVRSADAKPQHKAKIPRISEGML